MSVCRKCRPAAADLDLELDLGDEPSRLRQVVSRTSQPTSAEHWRPILIRRGQSTTFQILTLDLPPAAAAGGLEGPEELEFHHQERGGSSDGIGWPRSSRSGDQPLLDFLINKAAILGPEQADQVRCQGPRRRYPD